MAKQNHLLTVEFMCDSNGNHTAPMAECTDSQILDFNTQLERKQFVSECTYVYNLDVALGVPKNMNKPNPILDCIQDQNI